MKKLIRIVEVPCYLLTIATACIEMGYTGTAIFLIIVSAIRLYVNHITDESCYK